MGFDYYSMDDDDIKIKCFFLNQIVSNKSAKTVIVDLKADLLTILFLNETITFQMI